MQRMEPSIRGKVGREWPLAQAGEPRGARARPARRGPAGSGQPGAACWGRRLAVLLLLMTCCQREPAPPRGSGAAYDAYRRPERLLAVLHLQPGQRIAEIGAGGGYLTGWLARAVGPGGRVLATDISQEALAALRQRTRGLPQIETRVVTASDPGLEPGTYDLILLAQVDHLLPDRAAYLRALPAALARSGRIVLTNSVRYRQAASAASAAAGLQLEEADAGLPEQFVFILRPR